MPENSIGKPLNTFEIFLPQEVIRQLLKEAVDGRYLTFEDDVKPQQSKIFRERLEELTDRKTGVIRGNELAKRCDIDQSELSRIKSGDRPPYKNSVNRIADVLGLSRFDCLIASGNLSYRDDTPECMLRVLKYSFDSHIVVIGDPADEVGDYRSKSIINIPV